VTDEFGLDEGLLGEQATWLYPAIGRVVCSSAVLENKAQVLAESISGAIQGSLAMARMKELEAIALKAAKRVDEKRGGGADPIRPHVAEFFATTRRLLDRRNAIVHAMWPAQPGPQQFGWRPPARADAITRVTTDNTAESMIDLIAQISDQVLHFPQLLNRASAAQRIGLDTTRIDLDTGEGAARQPLRVNGIVQSEDYPLRWTDIEGMPFAGVYIGGQRQYDVELWLDGNLLHRVPARSDAAAAAYDRIEARQHPQPRRRRPAFDPGAVPTLDQLKSEMREHPGQVAYMRWEGLRRSVAVHDRNARDLGALLEVVEESDEIAIEMFQNTAPPIVREEIEGHIDQRLHNYVSSTASLIDHTRRVLNAYEGSELAREYETRKRVVIGSDSVAFIRDLRNYTTHRELPFIGNTVSFGAQQRSYRAQIELSVDELLKWDGWKAASRAYLHGSDSKVVLRDVVLEHVEVLRDLYEWVLRQFEPLHRYDLVGLDGLRDEYNWVLSGGTEGWPREPR
jgi:hypothetical protein